MARAADLLLSTLDVSQFAREILGFTPEPRQAAVLDAIQARSAPTESSTAARRIAHVSHAEHQRALSTSRRTKRPAMLLTGVIMTMPRGGSVLPPLRGRGVEKGWRQRQRQSHE